MFAKKTEINDLDRLKKRSDFLCVQRTGKKWVSKGMIVEIAHNDNLGIRYGLTVSKKVSKLAVMRNRIKRRLKAVANDVLPAYAGIHLDIVLVGRQASEKRDYKDLQNDLRWCLKKMGIEKAGAEGHDQKASD